MSRPETENIDRLFLELSQFTAAETKRELEQHDEIERLREALREVVRIYEQAGLTEDVSSDMMATARRALHDNKGPIYRITDEQIDAAWERIHKPGFDPTSSAVILEGFKMLGIVRCEGCGGSGDVMDVDHPDPYAIKTCPDCNGRGWRKTCCQ